MNKKIVALSLTGLSLVLALTGCSGASVKVDEEIKIPIYNNEDGTTTYETAKVESKDILAIIW